MTTMFLVNAFKDLLWPRACLACGLKTTDPVMCGECNERSKRVTVPDERPSDDHVRPAVAHWKFDRNEPIRFVLHRLKYGNCPWIGLHLGATMADSSTWGCRRWDLIVPVPLHPVRLLERGYNQSEWIALGLGRALDVRVAPQALSRRKNTRSQTNLTREDRTTNVAGAFAIDDECALDGSNVLLVDDTLTTGATLTAAADVLVAAGACAVQPLAVALATLRKDEEQPDPGSVIPSRHQPAIHESSFLGYNL